MNLRRSALGKLLRGGRHWLAGKYREVPLAAADLRSRVTGNSQNHREAGLNPENIVWIFGSGRSGSTWLRSMMSELDGYKVWEEPLVGRLFGEFYDRSLRNNLDRPDFIMGDSTRRGWVRSIRNFILDGARYVHPNLKPGDYLVVKEPNGSVGAPLLMKALPESRMVFLIRDPRDVVASTLDGVKEGNWLYEWRMESGPKRSALADDNPDAFVRRRANTYVLHAGNAKKAYDAHKGRKVAIKYEDLRANTFEVMEHLYSVLDIPVDKKKLSQAIQKHDWENIPENEKGDGKFYRKASPGSWKDDLTPRQVQIVEQITSPLLEEFYT